MRTDGRAEYRAVLANREFVALILSQSLSVVGDQIARIAVALLVYARTGSALAASATYAVSYGAYLLGGPLLSALADRHPRRTVMIVSDVLRMVLVTLLLADLPLVSIFAVVTLLGVVAPAFASARSANLPDMLGPEVYGTGQGLMSSAAQVSQFVGFAAGGTLVAAVGSDWAFGADAATFGVSALCIVLFVARRPAPSTVRTGLLREAREGAGVVWRSPALRRWLSWGLLLSTAAAAPEGLAVAVSRAEGGGPAGAGLLTAALPLGYVLGTVAVLRIGRDARPRLLPAAGALSFVPLVVTPLAGSLPAVIVLWVLAGMGGAAQVVANSEYALSCPPALRGRAFGLAGTAMMAWQAAVLILAGLAAGPAAPTTVIAGVGVLGAVATAALAARPAGAASRSPGDLPTAGVTEGVTT